MVLVGKFAIGILVGLLYGILGSIAAIGAGAGVFAAFGLDTELGSSDTWVLVGRMLLAFALWAVVGIGVGTVVRNQVAAIVIVLAVTLFIEPIVRTIAGVLALAFGGVASGKLPGAEGPTPSADGLAGLVYSSASAVGYVFPLLAGTL
ncbi:MAG: ABC transporter permease, partial [Microbacterium sp.]|nr:ABC transporter permease [Microbacterium sp.]